MELAVSEAERCLADLARRASDGEEVVLTRRDGPPVQLVPVYNSRDPAIRAAIIKAVQESAARHALPGPSAARSQDFLYDDETGLPA